MRQGLIILLFGVFLVSSSSAQEHDTTVYFPDGKISEQGKMLGEVKDGIWVSYDEKGGKISEIEYKHSAYSGKYATYFPNGNLQEEGRYKLVPVQTDTLSITFHNSSVADTFMSHEESEVKTGVWKEYCENGQLKSEGSYFPRVYIKRYGPDTVPDENGNLVVVINEIATDLKDGIWKYYNESGKLTCEEYWKNLRLISKNEY